jgi:CHASE2 domain-containing sensor protein
MAGKFPIKWHGWVALVVGAVLALAASDLPVGRRLDMLVYDLLMSTTHRPPVDRDDVAVIAIGDDDTIADPGLREKVRDVPRIFRRGYLSKVVETVLDAGAAGIGLDILLSSSVYRTCDSEADRQLKNVLRKSTMLQRPTVLGFYPASRGKKSEMPHDYFLLSVDRIAFLNFDEDLDEKRRTVPLLILGKDMEGRDITAHSLSFELAGLINKDLKVESPSHLKIDYRLAPVSTCAFWDIYSMTAERNALNESKLRDAFAGKIEVISIKAGVDESA